MDPPVKAGQLLLQQAAGGLRLGAKRWKKGWFVLYPASPHGVARLEFFDCKEGANVSDRMGTKRLDKKIVRLADCLSVTPVPDCSPKEGLAAFCLETSERTYLLAAEPQEMADWVAKLCEAAFLGSPGKGAPVAAEQGGPRSLEMATNSIYSSRDKGTASEFWVTVQKTEAAERCKLHGVYVLKATRDSLTLREPNSPQSLYTWPYRLLRRYGRDKVMFSFEAGRRCESGPGNFTFETKQGNEIFRVVEAAIQEQKAQSEENSQSGSSLDGETAGVAHLQSAIASALLLEGECPPPPPPPGKGLPRPPRSAKLSLAPEEKEAATPPRKGQGSRDPLPPRPGTPPRSPLSGLMPEDAGNVYSEPLDAVKGSRRGPDPLYADPLDSRRDARVAEDEAELERASALYERVGPPPSDRPGPSGAGAHIYDEPEGRAARPPPTPAPIYDEALLPREAWRTQGLESRAGYELPLQPGAGDYAVPAFHQTPGRKPSPAPKPPRKHKRPCQQDSTHKPSVPPMPSWAALKNGSGGGGSNNNNNHPRPEEGGGQLYCRVAKPLRACLSPVGREQSVDESRPASVYEDLGEI